MTTLVEDKRENILLITKSKTQNYFSECMGICKDTTHNDEESKIAQQVGNSFHLKARLSEADDLEMKTDWAGTHSTHGQCKKTLIPL